MRRYALLFAVVALAAAAFGVGGFARDAWAAQVVVVFLVLAAAALLVSGRWSRA